MAGQPCTGAWEESLSELPHLWRPGAHLLGTRLWALGVRVPLAGVWGMSSLRTGTQQWTWVPISCTTLSDLHGGVRTTKSKCHLVPSKRAFIPRAPLDRICAGQVTGHGLCLSALTGTRVSQKSESVGTGVFGDVWTGTRGSLCTRMCMRVRVCVRVWQGGVL